MPEMTASQVSDMIDSDSDPAVVGAENAHMSKWWYQSETRTDTGFKIECSRCGSAGFIDNTAGETISILCTNDQCDNDFEIHNNFA